MIYAPVEFVANNVFQKIQAMEFAGLVGIGASAIRLKNPNMCSAANLVFEKSVFFEVGGYKGNDGIASGDDEFLLHKVFKYYPSQVVFLKDIEAIVHTSANASVKELTEQRRRWVSKSTKYENRYITAILVCAYFFNLSIVLFTFIDIKMFAILLMCKMLSEGCLLFFVLKFFKKAHYLFLLPIAEFFHVIYVLVIGVMANIGTYNWKGRSLK
jgi:cellulose synthase/poly-beta-1,6-N-acetylglucosamine synthase-like glycosyltransferase